MRYGEAGKKERSYGHVMIDFGAEDMGCMWSYAEISVDSREELAEVLKNLEAVLKRMVDEHAKKAGTGYGPLKDPHFFLNEIERQYREYEEQREQEWEEYRRKEEEEREANRRTCPICGKETTARQLRIHNRCKRCERGLTR